MELAASDTLPGLFDLGQSGIIEKGSLIPSPNLENGIWSLTENK